MYLKSVSENILYEGRFSSVKKGVEMAVADNVDLAGINLRCANMAHANLDNAKMGKACLWGANLSHTDLCGADLQGADFRTAHLLHSCLVEANCNEADFKGAYFVKTILTRAKLSGAEFSCPSVFNVNLNEAALLDGAVYYHMGEIGCDLSSPPLVIQGLVQPVILMKDKAVIGSVIQEVSLRDLVFNFIQSQLSAQEILV
jgi:hypothetical protein